MKMLVVALMLSVVSLSAQATCTNSDFAIQDVHAGMAGSKVVVAGKVVSHCAIPLGAQLQVDAKDATGKVLVSKKGWPNGTSNIEPNQEVSFDLGRLIRPEAGMQTYTVSVVDTKSW